MIDIKFLRENPDVVRASQKGRGEDVTLVDQVIAIDEKRRAAINEFELLRAEQNALSKSVGGAKGDEKAKLLESAKDLANKVKSADAIRAELEAQTQAIALQLSNVLDPNAPIGKEEDFVILEHVGTPREFTDFEPKDHVELGKLLGAIDTERGAKVSGSRSYYLTGVGALPWPELNAFFANYTIAGRGFWESMIINGHQATGSLLIVFSLWLLCRVERRCVASRFANMSIQNEVTEVIAGGRPSPALAGPGVS